MRNFFHSLRWRVQAWHALILFFALTAFCLTAFRLAWNNQVRRVDQTLAQAERSVVRALFEALSKSDALRAPADSASTGVQEPRPVTPARLIEELVSGKIQLPEEIAARFRGTEPGYLYFILREGSGRVLLQSPNVPPDLARQPAPQSAEEMRTVNHRRELLHRGPDTLHSVFGLDLTVERDSLRRLALSLTLVAFGVWMLGLLGGWWLAGRAIKPIQTISGTATRIAEGNLSERISIHGTDNELDQLSRVLNNTFERLHAAFERQKRFTADASHELRTPVTILLTETQRILKRDRTPADYKAAMELCHATAERMRRLTEALLQLSYQESSGPTMPRERCDLAEIARDCVQQLAPLAEARRLALMPELAPAPCLGNPAALHTLITNLISNALQHHDQTTGTIRVATRTTDGQAVVAIVDDGPGIPAADLPHLFERFYRVDPSRTGGSGHSGLGLAIAQTIVENHRGSLTADNNATGRGACFLARFPLPPSER